VVEAELVPEVTVVRFLCPRVAERRRGDPQLFQQALLVLNLQMAASADVASRQKFLDLFNVLLLVAAVEVEMLLKYLHFTVASDLPAASASILQNVIEVSVELLAQEDAVEREVFLHVLHLQVDQVVYMLHTGYNILQDAMVVMQLSTQAGAVVEEVPVQQHKELQVLGVLVL
jgi:hypothetical protein